MKAPLIRRGRWIRAIPRADLNQIHHALRLSAQHPMLDTEGKGTLEALADEFWNESVRRND